MSRIHNDDFDREEQYRSIYHSLTGKYYDYLQKDLYLYYLAYLSSLGADVPEADSPSPFVCFGCGTEYEEGARQWSSVNTLYVKGKIAGYIHIWHCRDCDPHDVLEEALSEEIQIQDKRDNYSEAWKTVQGNLD